MNKDKIFIEVLINENCEKVWNYWIDPKHIIQWNFASNDWCCPKASNDLKVGGEWFSRMEAKDGSFGFDFKGIYDQVDHKEFLSYKLEDGRQVQTTFENLGDSTKVSTLFDPESENPLELQKNGWQAILNNFKNYVESNK